MGKSDRERARKAADRLSFSLTTQSGLEEIWSVFADSAEEVRGGDVNAEFECVQASRDADGVTARWVLREPTDFTDTLVLHVDIGLPDDHGRRTVVVKVRNFLYRPRGLGLPPALHGAHRLRQFRKALTERLERARVSP